MDVYKLIEKFNISSELEEYGLIHKTVKRGIYFRGPLDPIFAVNMLALDPRKTLVGKDRIPNWFGSRLNEDSIRVYIEKAP